MRRLGGSMTHAGVFNVQRGVAVASWHLPLASHLVCLPGSLGCPGWLKGIFLLGNGIFISLGFCRFSSLYPFMCALSGFPRSPISPPSAFWRFSLGGSSYFVEFPLHTKPWLWLKTPFPSLLSYSYSHPYPYSSLFRLSSSLRNGFAFVWSRVPGPATQTLVAHLASSPVLDVIVVFTLSPIWVLTFGHAFCQDIKGPRVIYVPNEKTECPCRP